MLAGEVRITVPQALLLREANLARLLSRRVKDIFIAEYEQGDIGSDLFRDAFFRSGHAVKKWPSVTFVYLPNELDDSVSECLPLVLTLGMKEAAKATQMRFSEHTTIAC